MEQVEVLVVGGGSAGLSVSHQLAGLGIDHLVLDRGRIGQAWRDRWDSFCLVTPNWTMQPPGGAYAGDDPDGFMPRDEIVDHLVRYAAGFGAPVREGVAVRTMSKGPDGFIATTSAGDVHATRVVLCTGAYQRANRPAASVSLPPGLLQMDLADYRNAAGLPPGRILIVGSGQSGCQLSEEIREAGRDVVLSCGRAPWAARRMSGRDMFWWLNVSGFLDVSVASLASPAARLVANPLASGHGGGHDLSLRTLQRMGVTLVGRFIGADGQAVHFAPDLADTVTWSDARHRELIQWCRQAATLSGLPWDEIGDPEPIYAPEVEKISLEGLGAVIFTGGFRPDFRAWLPWADAFDEMGFPIQVDGASTVVPGLYFVGTPFLRKRKSSNLLGVGDDATVVAQQIAAAMNSAVTP